MNETNLKKEPEKERTKENGKTILCFLLGILLSVVLSVSSVLAVLPKNTASVESSVNPAAVIKIELISDTLETRLGEYLKKNGNQITEAEVEQIASYVAQEVKNGMPAFQPKDVDLTELENLIHTNIQDLAELQKYITVEDLKVKEKAEEENQRLKQETSRKNKELEEKTEQQQEEMKKYTEESDDALGNELKNKMASDAENQKQELKGYTDENSQKIRQEAQEQKEELENQSEAGDAALEKELKEYSDTKDAALEKEMKEYSDTKNAALNSELKEFIQTEVVPPITAVLTMHSEEIIEINKRIAALGREYDLYKESTDASLVNIQNSIEDYAAETAQNFASVTAQINALTENYSAFVENTDGKIAQIEQSLGKKLSVSDFESFKEGYDAYKENVNASIASLEEIQEGLEDRKADKTEVAALTEKLNGLKTSYETFTGSTGDFAGLTNRMSAVETMTAESKNNISVLAAKTAQTESEVADLNRRLTEAENAIKNAYPVGSVYISVNSQDPSTLFGGKWERIQDTFLMAAGSAYPAGTAGGSNTVTLSANQIPSLNVSGSTAAKSLTTGADGAYSGKIQSKGTYDGKTLETSSAGNHNHDFSRGGNALVLSADSSHQTMLYNQGFEVAGNSTSWFYAIHKNVSSIASAGNHKHSIVVPDQTITSTGSLSIGNHTHALSLPALPFTGTYTNNSLRGVNVTNKYISVYVWKRVA